ncbi:hypothetical protein FRC19_009142 [Serendipita sp. 401]|nr:hypothetical protein FRC19_009142 [Serendipita sp. 401]
MTRHSKNNTASSVFSYAEHQKLKQAALYGTQRVLLGSNTHRAYNACSLCLAKAINPVACQKGHLYCKECVVKDLLTQREALARKKAEIEALRKEEEQAREEVRLKARELILAGGSQSLFGKRKEREEDGDNTSRSNKRRKFEFDSEDGKRLAEEAEEEAIRRLEVEQNEARKAKLPAFWLPSLTPESQTRLPPLTDIKLQTMCNAAEPPHPLLMKHLIPVSFSFTPNPSSNKSASTSSTTPSDEQTCICPSCQKELSNTTKLTCTSLSSLKFINEFLALEQ